MLQTKWNLQQCVFLGSQNFWVLCNHWLYQNTLQDQLYLAWLYITRNICIYNLDENLLRNNLNDFWPDTLSFFGFQLLFVQSSVSIWVRKLKYFCFIKAAFLIASQQTFVLMKTSWRRLEDVFRLRLQETSRSRRICSP